MKAPDDSYIHRTSLGWLEQDGADFQGQNGGERFQVVEKNQIEGRYRNKKYFVLSS